MLEASHPINLQLKFREAQMERAEKHAHHRLAALRWQYAGLAIRAGQSQARRKRQHKLEDIDDTLVAAVSLIDSCQRFCQNACLVKKGA